MDTKEARKIAYITEAEEASIERYLGFQHTGLNILGNLSPEAYVALRKSGWLMPEKEEDVKFAIEDFVNLYSAMYKNMKSRNLTGNTFGRRNLVRGTSSKRASELYGHTNQFFSTSTREDIAKTFCEYGDAAILRIDIDENVPYLYAEEYRGTQSRNEEEIILAPFCKIKRKELSGNWNGFEYYNVSIGKPELKAVPEERLQELYEEVIKGFSGNLIDMEEYIKEEDMPEIWSMRSTKAIDLEDKKYILQEKKKCYEKLGKLSQRTSDFKSKLQELLMGLCKQKEREIDEATEVLEQDRKEREEAYRKKQEQERIEKEKLEREEKRKKLILETSKKLGDGPKNSEQLLDTIENIYKGLKRNEQIYGDVARTLGIDYTKRVSTTDIPKRLKEIEENISNIDKKTRETEVDSKASLEEVEGIFKDISPLLDGISYGNEIMSVCTDIVEKHTLQSERNVKKNLYFKVQGIIQNVRQQRLLQERKNVEEEKIGFFGRLFGREELKTLKLQNIDLKLQKLREEKPEEQKNYSIRQILADMYACKVTDCNGNMPVDMEDLYLSIKRIFKDGDGKEFSEEYIRSCAEHKIRESRNIRKFTNGT